MGLTYLCALKQSIFSISVYLTLILAVTVSSARGPIPTARALFGDNTTFWLVLIETQPSAKASPTKPMLSVGPLECQSGPDSLVFPEGDQSSTSPLSLPLRDNEPHPSPTF